MRFSLAAPPRRYRRVGRRAKRLLARVFVERHGFQPLFGVSRRGAFVRQRTVNSELVRTGESDCLIKTKHRVAGRVPPRDRRHDWSVAGSTLFVGETGLGKALRSFRGSSQKEMAAPPSHGRPRLLASAAADAASSLLVRQKNNLCSLRETGARLQPYYVQPSRFTYRRRRRCCRLYVPVRGGRFDRCARDSIYRRPRSRDGCRRPASAFFLSYFISFPLSFFLSHFLFCHFQ
ncbi:unnamed protein product [Acanthosepion pharaonis]|uniref:Uncharacterized protein n=1 Tax=Acanthosepion pharaonis TaxID=158019 RepID=A0A812BBT0_ACAPH|nr:unnamed protein product [Sepia pharaonis]